MKLQPNVIREIIRLLLTTDFSARRIANILKVAPNTVGFYRKSLEKLGLTWEQLNKLNDNDLIIKFKGSHNRKFGKEMPDFVAIHERFSKTNI